MRAARSTASDLDSIADIGGIRGFGPGGREEGYHPFHKEWEGRLWGVLRQLRRLFHESAGELRDRIERIDPVIYLSSGYYERYLHITETQVVARGLVTAEELAERRAALREHPQSARPRRDDPAAVAAF